MPETKFGVIPDCVASTAPEEVKKHMQSLSQVSKRDSWKTVNAFTKSTAPGDAKILYLVRHGQATHNKAALEDGPGAYMDEKYTDAHLTDMGKTQANGLAEYCSKLDNVKYVAVSPLARAVETALLAFGGDDKLERKFVAYDSLHEQSGSHPCDKRRSKTEIQKEYPNVDFAGCTELDDAWTPERETKQSVADRAYAFLQEIQQVPDKEVAVVGHSSHLLTLMNAVVTVDEPGLANWFENCELRVVGVV